MLCFNIGAFGVADLHLSSNANQMKGDSYLVHVLENQELDLMHVFFPVWLNVFLMAPALQHLSISRCKTEVSYPRLTTLIGSLEVQCCHLLGQEGF